MMRQAEAVVDRPHLHGDEVAIDRAPPDGFDRPPSRHEVVRIAGQPVRTDEEHRNGVVFTRDRMRLQGCGSTPS